MHNRSFPTLAALLAGRAGVQSFHFDPEQAIAAPEPVESATETADTPADSGFEPADDGIVAEDATATAEDSTPAEPPTPPATPPAQPPAAPAAEAKEPAPAAEPQRPAEDPAAVQLHLQAVQQFRQEWTGLEAKLDKGYDPIDDGPAAVKTIMSGMKLLGQQYAQMQHQIDDQQRQAQQRGFFDQLATTHKLPVDQVRQAYQQEHSRLASRFKGEALDAAITIALENRLRTPQQTSTPAKPKPPAAPMTAGGARITPRAGVTPPKPTPRSIEEKIAAGEYPGILDGIQ